MAGSRRSPVLKDDWRAAANDTGDHHRRRPHQSRPYRDRGRERYRERDRPPRPKDNGLDRPFRSPPPSRAFPHPGREAPHKHRGFPSNDAPSPRGSPGPPPDELMESRRNFNHPRFSQSSDHPDFRPWEATEREPWRDDSPSAPPPSKRKRTRSPSSPRRPYHRTSNPRHPRHNPRHGEGFDRGFSKRGRFSTRGRAGRGSFPPRGRGRRGRGGSFRGRDSLSPGRGRDSLSPPRGWSRSPYPEDHPEGDFRRRSMSRHSTQSGHSRVSAYSRRDSVDSTRPRRPGMDDFARSPSPRRPISSFDADNASASGDGDANIRASNQRSRPPRSPQYMKSNNSYQGSPRSASPYSGRGWGGQRPYHGEQRYVKKHYATSLSPNFQAK